MPNVKICEFSALSRRFLAQIFLSVPPKWAIRIYVYKHIPKFVRIEKWLLWGKAFDFSNKNGNFVSLTVQALRRWPESPALSLKAMSVNKVILVGNVGKAPEIRYIDSRPCATFSLATTERAYRAANGAEVAERTEWHNIVMWDRAAEIAERYISKGTKLYIEGKLRTRDWQDRNAINRKVTEIFVDTFDILSRPTQ